MRIALTQHALRRLAERRIPLEWIEITLEQPDLESPDSTDPKLMRAFKRLPQADGRVLRVVYSVRGEEKLVITAFFDRDA
jgi:hypothetical protein